MNFSPLRLCPVTPAVFAISITTGINSIISLTAF